MWSTAVGHIKREKSEELITLGMILNTQEHILIVAQRSQEILSLDQALRSQGFQVAILENASGLLDLAARSVLSLVVLDGRSAGEQCLDLLAEFAWRFPSLPVVMLANQDSPASLRRAMRLGVADYLVSPVGVEDILHAVQASLDMARRRKDAHLVEARRFTATLQRQVDEMEALARLGRQVTSSLSLDSVLASIVDAAVELTGAEEGSLLLIDEATGELYMRASRNFQEDFVRTFRLPVTDSIAGSVIRSGEAFLFDANTPQKIKTSYLVQSLLYVPLQLHGHVFGVLGVDNRQSRLPLTQRHVRLLNTLAGYAVIALENARLYGDISAEHSKLETILNNIHDGVIVVGPDRRLVLVNKVARQIFNIGGEENLKNLPFQAVFNYPELLDLLSVPEGSPANQTELSLDEDHLFSVRVARIQGVGQALTLYDLTNFKKLDRIKTEFVQTVSHNLRSPLTSILGYVELIGRAGPVNDMQSDFIRRVQTSVRNITYLVDDLIDLGRIESGFDLRRENVSLEQLIRFAADGMKKALAAKSIHLQIIISPGVPSILANPVQMRQVIDHLLDNAIKYTLPGGKITIWSQMAQNQIILQVSDTGIGIPAIDLPNIFDRFYRASNAGDISGTGLGLAIVKTIVEYHGGRIWVDSTVGAGTTFTIVLPLAQQ